MKLPADIAAAKRAHDAACAAEGRELDINDPTLDGTDAAHPAWWRGHDRATEAWRERVATAERERDAARAELATARAAEREYLAACEALDTTLEEFRAHVAKGDADAARESMRAGAVALQRCDAARAALAGGAR